MSGKRIGYIRVSTEEQNPARQLEGLVLDKTFIEYASGKNTDRKQLALLLEYVREDDQVYVHSMDRMARNVRDLCRLVDELVEKNVQVHFMRENLIFNGKQDAISRLMLSIMGAVAEFELARIKERQAEGIRLAQKAGKYKGRPKSLTQEQANQIRIEYHGSRKSMSEIARAYGVSHSTVHRHLKQSNKCGDANGSDR